MLDAHCHFWRLDRGDYDWLEGETAALAPLRFDFLPQDYPGPSKVIAVQAAATRQETDFLLSLMAQTPQILGVVGWIDLTDDKALATIPTGLVGLRPMLQDIAQTDWLLHRPSAKALADVKAAGLCFDALITQRHLPVLLKFCHDHPELKVIIDHAAKPKSADQADWRAGMRALAALPQVCCKLSGLVTELEPPFEDNLKAVFNFLLEAFGPDRLIWGSDWPVLTLKASYDEWLTWTDQLLRDLSSADQKAIMGQTAARIYGVSL